MDKPQRWSRRKDARPQEILEAALGVFAEKGFAATRMEDIAREAGVTKGTIYLYFDNKEAVFKSLVRESLGSRIAEITASVEGYPGPSADLIRMALAIAISFLTSADNRIALPKIVIAEAGNFPELARFYREEVIERGLSALGAAIERGVARGEFRPVDAHHVARIVIAPMLLSLFWRTTFARFDSEPYDYSGLIETHADILLRGLRAEKVEP